MRLLVCLILMGCLGLGSQARAQQQYPVNATILVYPPYPIYLNDYANTALNSFEVRLLLRDIELGARQVSLKVQLTPQGGTPIPSRFPAVGLPPIELVSGVPVILKQADLAPYFQPQNMNLSANAYAQPLPEGVYTISIQVFDYLTNKQLSVLHTSAPFWVVISDPPLLNSPANNGFVVEQTPQNVIFQWTPRTKQTASVEYEFTLTELIGVTGFTGNLQNLFLAQPPYYTVTTPATSLVYSPALPPLIRGRMYGYRVRAKAKQGLESVGIFRNDGYSEIHFFIYGYDNQAPFNETADWSKTLDLSWDDNMVRNNFQIRYREKGTQPWLQRTITGQQARYGNSYRYSMPDLQDTKNYEYQIGGVSMQDPNNIAYTPIRTVNAAYQVEIVKKKEIVDVPETVVTTTIQLVCKTTRIGFFPMQVCTNQPVSTTTIVVKKVEKEVIVEVKKPIDPSDDLIDPIELDGNNHNDLLSDDSTGTVAVTNRHAYTKPTCENPAVNIDMSTEGTFAEGDTLHVAGYDIIALGNDKGMVLIDMPFVSKKVAFALNFKDVKVNEFLELKSGSMETTFSNEKYSASIAKATTAKGAAKSEDQSTKQELKKGGQLPIADIKVIDSLTKAGDDLTLVIRNQFLNKEDVTPIKTNINRLKTILTDKSNRIQKALASMNKDLTTYSALTDKASQRKVAFLTKQIQLLTSQKTKNDAQLAKVNAFISKDRFWTSKEGFLKNGPILFGATVVATK